MQEEYWQIVQENAQDYDKIVVPIEYTIRKKRNVMSEDLRKVTIPVKLFGSWGKSRVKLSSLFDFNLPIFYGIQDDEGKLTRAHNLYKLLFDADSIVSRYSEGRHEFYRSEKNAKKGIMFIMLSKSNVKYMEHCKKAVHIDQFYNKLLYRKADIVQSYFQTYNIVERYEQLKDLYKNENFSKIHALWGKKIKDVNKFIKNLPASKLNLSSYKHDLGIYFKLDSAPLSDEQRKFKKLIEDLHELQKRNSNVLNYINNYYYSGNLDNTLTDILSKIMVFK
jgi:hypothetical protein